MKKTKKIRLLPAFITLLAGAITSISLYVTNQDLITTLLVLFIVLFVFYFVGVLAMKIIMDFMNRKEPEEPVSDEGSRKGSAG